MTKGEQTIHDILAAARINFIQEKTFTDLRGGRFRFDFYLPDHNILCEYQGRQHYIWVPYFHRTQLDFQQSQGRDMRKISYALAHSIPLYLIPYWDLDLDNLHSVDDILNPAYLAHDRYANIDAYANYLRSNH